MASSEPDISSATLCGDGAFAGLFDGLTLKQREVFDLVAENRTSKEIAGYLGISESAVNQRIEAVRSRASSLPRGQIARAYRHYRAAQASAGASSQEAAPGGAADAASAMHEGGPENGLGVPDMLVGPNGRLNRVAAMVFIAGGLMVVAFGSLAVTQALTSAL
jgi:DNA-binding CsgD family transcriptional regulator